jgi:hypothetical protein
MFWMAGTGSAGMVVVKNNIFWLSSGVNFASSKFNSGQMVHSNNIYRMSSGSLGITLNNSELLSTNASLFTSVSGGPADWNYTLPSTSAAVNFGTNVGLVKDFAGNPINGNPDAGMLEYASTVVEPTPLDALASAGSINCNGGTTTVVVSATGGTSPYTGTGSFTVAAGSYKYFVTDAKGLKDSVGIVVAEPTAVAASLTSGSITVAGGTTSITVNASGGTSPYLYNINNGAYQSSNVFSNLVAGTYTVNTKDSKGCTLGKSITIAAYQDTVSTVYVSFKASVYPNPTTNYFKVSIYHYHSNYPVYIAVANANGNIVYTVKGDAYTTYSFGNSFPSGTYYVKITIAGTTKSYTVVKL